MEDRSEAFVAPSLLQVRGLSVSYATRRGAIRAVDGVDLTLEEGEIHALVGESGCGKSTLGLAVLGLIPPPGKIVGGSILLNGEDLAKKQAGEMRKIRGKRVSMIFQDPMTSLDPLQRVTDHLIETLRAHIRIKKKDAYQKSVSMVEKLGIAAQRIEDYPHQFSGGMRQRVMTALALILSSELVIADEPTTALDVVVQAQILELLKFLKHEIHMSMILITHDLGVAAELADKISVMYAGRIAENADVGQFYEKPLHPYSEGLLRSVPNIALEDQNIASIPGAPPDLAKPPGGCRFHPRCPYAFDACSKVDPPLLRQSGGSEVACLLFDPKYGRKR